MFNQEADKEVKLDWMYKGPHSTVDREEYLLGRTVDKTLEHINAEENQSSAPPKHKVEHECIPPSIRDFNKIIQAEQVDLSAKLQEDPLVAIKKREEETRRQFLQNPIQLKKLQKALKEQEEQKHKKKSKKKRSKHKKAKKDRDELNLDTILIHKYEELKDKLTDEDMRNIMEGKITDSSSSESSEPENDSSDNDGGYKANSKRPKYDANDGKRAKRRDFDRSGGQNEFRNYSERKRETKRYSREDERKSEVNHRGDRSKKRDYGGKEAKKREKSPSSSSEGGSDSDSRSKNKAKRAYGLVTCDGKRIKLKKEEAKVERRDKGKKSVEQPKVVHKSRANRLTEEEKEKRRREMMVNAIERDRERAESLRKYREGLEVEGKQQEYDPDFVVKEMVKLTKYSSVESRIKANLSNIQRTRSDMDRHFSKRN